MPDTVLGADNTAVSRTDMPALRGLLVIRSERMP